MWTVYSSPLFASGPASPDEGSSHGSSTHHGRGVQRAREEPRFAAHVNRGSPHQAAPAAPTPQPLPGQHQQLEDTVPPGASAAKAFLLMQQARIDALESDMAQLHRERQQEQGRQQEQERAAAARPRPWDTYNLPPLAAAFAMQAAAAAPPPPAPLPPPRRRVPFKTLWTMLAQCVLTAGIVCTTWGGSDLANFNSPVSALVTAAAPSFQAPCAANVTVPALHHAAARSTTVALDVCVVAGDHVPMCCRWQRPASCRAGKCSAGSYAQSLALLIAGVVLLSVAVSALYFLLCVCDSS